MSYRGKIGEGLLRLILLIGLIVVSVIPVRSRALAQEGAEDLWVVRSLSTREYGVTEARGLAFSSQANTFLILDGNANLALVTMGEEPAGTRILLEVGQDGLNAAFDERTGSLFVLKHGQAELARIKADSQGLPAASAERARFALGALKVNDPQGIAFDAAGGRMFILDAEKAQIVTAATDPNLGFNTTGSLGYLSLKELGVSQPKGIAYHPGNGHLFVGEPVQKKLHELTENGDLISSFDLAALGINNPSAMTFAPSVDNTDDPGIYDLYVLDSGAAGGSQIVELSFQVPAALPPETTLLPASLVHLVDTSSWNPPAPDPAGIDYFPLTDRLIISDSEVDEMPIFEGKNVFLSTRAGNLTGTCSTFPFRGQEEEDPPISTGEPTGVAVNPGNDHIFIVSDFQDRLFEISPGSDRQYCTADDTVTNTSLGAAYGVTDAEDVAYGNKTIFIAGGTDAEVFVIPLGSNDVVGGGDDGQMTHWDTAALGFADTEGIGYNEDNGTLFVVSTKRTDKYLGEFDTSGTLLRAYDLSFMPNVGNIRSDVTYAPSSGNPSVKNIYIVSRGVDNDTDPNENDGQIWEISIGSGPSPTPTKTNTPGPGPTATNTPPTSDLIFANGFETGNFSAWSSNTNDGGDLSVTTAAALIETRGMQAVIDDNNPIFVTDDTPNAEPRYRARFYFDPNSIQMAGGDNHFIFQGYSGTTTAVLRIQFRFSSGNYQLRAALRPDGSGWTNTNWFTISDAPHFIELDWRAASGPGANNGGLALWIDNNQQANLTTADNDTRRIDRVQLGAISGIDTGTRGTYYFDAFESRRQTFIGPADGPPPPTATNTPPSGPTPTPTATNTPGSSDLIFADSFETGNLSAWSSNTNDGGDLSVSAAAALVGSQGMQAVINNNTSIYVTDDMPNAEPRYRARFYFHPNSIQMASGDNHFIFQGYSGSTTLVLRVQFRFSNGNYQLRAALRDDGSSWTNTSWFTLNDVSHFIELDWQAATSAGANNGSLALWIDGTQQASLTGVDNDTRRIDRVRLGAVAGIDTGTRGTYYFDAFESRQ